MWNSSDIFVVHVDAKTPARIYDQFVAIALRPNVEFLRRLPVNWGTWSLVQVELNAIKRLLEIDSSWTHFVNLSGFCHPLTTRSAFVERLRSNPEANFVDFHTRAQDAPDLRQRFEWVWSWSDAAREPVVSGIRKQTPSFEITYNGEAWHVLTRAFCEWIVRDPLAETITAYFADAAIPEEFTMQALLLNSPFAKTASPCLWKTVWREGAYHPEILVSEHLDMLLASQASFARKFDATVDVEILQHLANLVRDERV